MTDTNSDTIITPSQMLEKASKAGFLKANLSFNRMMLLAILAGMYIAFGGVFSTIIATGSLGDWPYGIVKTLQGVVFSLGLILVIIGGAELFTGNILMIIPLIQRKISVSSMLRNWGVVYVGNFLGSLIVAGLIYIAGSFQSSGGQVGLTMLKIANLKLNYSFTQAVALGVLCNILVCLAVWLCYAAKSSSDKIFSILFPISAFIAAGFEHSVANMYLIPAALMIKAFNPGFLIENGITPDLLRWDVFLTHNLVPVTIGNIIGGGLFVAVFYTLIYSHKTSTTNDTKQ